MGVGGSMYNWLIKLYKTLKQKLKHLHQVIKYVKKQSGKLYIVILFDIIWCYIVYLLDLEEYKKLEFYNINHSLRKTYLNEAKHDLIKTFLHKKANLVIINNKEKFLQRFKNYIKSEIVNINKISYKEFEETLMKNKKIICRSTNQSFVSSFEIYDAAKFRGPGFVLEKAKKNKLLLVEKYIDQHKKLKEITDNLVVINLVTMINKNNVDVISSYVSFKENNQIIRGYIDLKKEKTKGHFRDSNNNIYENISGEYEIPCLEEMINFVKETAKEITEIKEVEWSLCLDTRGKIHLMDATTWKQIIFAQTPEYLNKKVGLLPYYKKIIK